MLYACMCCGRTCHLFTSLVHRHSMSIHVHECCRRGYEIIRVHMYKHACVCAHLCDGKLAIAPDKTSSCVRIHMYALVHVYFSLLHVVQLKGGGGRFVCSVYMYACATRAACNVIHMCMCMCMLMWVHKA